MAEKTKYEMLKAKADGPEEAFTPYEGEGGGDEDPAERPAMNVAVESADKNKNELVDTVQMLEQMIDDAKWDDLPPAAVEEMKTRVRALKEQLRELTRGSVKGGDEVSSMTQGPTLGRQGGGDVETDMPAPRSKISDEGAGYDNAKVNPPDFPGVAFHAPMAPWQPPMHPMYSPYYDNPERLKRRGGH